MSTAHLLFFDTTYEAIGQWVVDQDELQELELFPYGVRWHEDEVLRWQEEGFPVKQEMASDDHQIFSLQTRLIPQKSPEGLSAFLAVCRNKNWPSLVLSEANYPKWFKEQQSHPEDSFKLAQILGAPPVVPLSKGDES